MVLYHPLAQSYMYTVKIVRKEHNYDKNADRLFRAETVNLRYTFSNPLHMHVLVLFANEIRQNVY